MEGELDKGSPGKASGQSSYNIAGLPDENDNRCVPVPSLYTHVSSLEWRRPLWLFLEFSVQNLSAMSSHRPQWSWWLGLHLHWALKESALKGLEPLIL